jgi:hypothetical protein
MYTAGNMPGMRTASNGALRGRTDNTEMSDYEQNSNREKRNGGVNTNIKSR